MVVFTCNHCGESLQKPRVEKHYVVQCRRPKSLTCVDCFKDFRNDEYTVHTKCITEEERYSAKGSIPGGIVKKGDVKQESWIEMIQKIIQTAQNLKPSVANLFATISTYSNVPRKKAKFINFIKSSTGNRVNFGDIEAAWDLIEKYKDEEKKSHSEKCNEIKENGTKHKATVTGEEPAKKKKKIESLKVEENPLEQESCEGVLKKKQKTSEKTALIELGSDDLDKFSFKGTILNILNSKGSISCKKLQKKVLNAYLKETGNLEYTEKTVKKYNKKLKKLDNVLIQDGTVSLLSNSEQ